MQHSSEDEVIALQWLSRGIVGFEGNDDVEFDGDEEMLLPREIEAVVFSCLKRQRGFRGIIFLFSFSYSVY